MSELPQNTPQISNSEFDLVHEGSKLGTLRLAKDVKDASKKEKYSKRIETNVPIYIGLGFVGVSFFLSSLMYEGEQQSMMTVWNISSAFLMLTLVSLWLLTQKSLSAQSRFMEHSFDEFLESSKQLVRDEADTYVGILSTKTDLQEAFVELINDALKEDAESKIITYLGASSLVPNEETSSKAAAELNQLQKQEDKLAQDSKELEPADKERKREVKTITELYKANGDLLNPNNPAKLVRFVNLNESCIDTFENHRADNFLNGFIEWLEKQEKLLADREATYELFSAVRSPEYQGSVSVIASNDYIIEIIGDGKRGLLLKGKRIANQYLDAAKSYYREAGKESNRPHPISADDLLEIRNRIKNRLSNASG